MMSQYNPNIHHRRSIRLKNYDYRQAGLYFITICCQDRAELFGNMYQGKMHLNDFGKIAHEEWENSVNIRDNIRIHEFIIMPNHIHGIIEIVFKKGEDRTGKFKSPSHTIGSIIRGYKIATIKKIKDKIKNESTRGESQFAPNPKDVKDVKGVKGELQFAPIPIPTDQFAPAPTDPIPIDPKIEKKIIQLNYKIWQRNYYEIIIRNEQSYNRISEYIKNNPKKWDNNKLNSKQAQKKQKTKKQ